MEQLGQLYASAVALIVPSLWYEVFGLVIIEAFVQRTPAIVRNIGGMPEIIAESGGVRVDRGGAADGDGPVARRLRPEGDVGSRGHEAVQRRWSVDTHIARYLGLIEEVAGARRG